MHHRALNWTYICKSIKCPMKRVIQCPALTSDGTKTQVTTSHFNVNAKKPKAVYLYSSSTEVKRHMPFCLKYNLGSYTASNLKPLKNTSLHQFC